jgi:cephalosporin-C deacetylase
MQEVSALPLDVSLEPAAARSTEDVDVYEIQYTSLDGLRIAGWYCRPKAAWIPPPYPGIILAPGYISEPLVPKSWARQGYAALSLAPRGKLRSNARFNPGYPGLLVHNLVDRDTYGYRGFYIDACRAVDVMVGQSEVDADRIGVHGSSQGGALSIVLAALRGDAITCSAAGAPYLCGFMAAAGLTHSYPYEEINEYLRIHPDHEPWVSQAVSYYDVVNFAPMVRCPTLVYIGREDDVCPPETAVALHEQLVAPTQFVVMEGCAHDAGGHWMAAEVDKFLAEHLRPAPWRADAEVAR